MSAFVISGLIERRAQLAGDIEKAHESLRRTVIDLENLDATILQFDREFKVEAIRPKAFRPPKDWSNRGEMTRICPSILRPEVEPLTTRNVARQLLTERALNRSDQKLPRLKTKGVACALRKQQPVLRRGIDFGSGVVARPFGGDIGSGRNKSSLAKPKRTL